VHVVNLNVGRTHDPRPVLAGPWQYLRPPQLDAGATFTAGPSGLRLFVEAVDAPPR
jgi:hypothetical protein